MDVPPGAGRCSGWQEVHGNAYVQRAVAAARCTRAAQRTQVGHAPPVLGQHVERTALNLIRGVVGLIPGGDALFDQLQQSGALERAAARFHQETRRLGLTWAAISTAFAEAWDAATIAHPIRSVERIIGVFTDLIGRLLTFVADAGRKLLEFVVEGVLSLAGPVGRQVLALLKRGGEVFSAIARDPIGFAGNLIRAVSQGFQRFAANIATHVRNGVLGWLFGSLASAGIQLPAQFDLHGIVSLVLQLLGLTDDRLRTMLVELIGERRVHMLEQTFEFLRVLVTEGLGAAWQRILQFAEGLLDTVIGAIREWVMQTIIGQAITRLIALFTPAGAIIQAIMAVYNTVKFFIERAQQIARWSGRCSTRSAPLPPATWNKRRRLRRADDGPRPAGDYRLPRRLHRPGRHRQPHPQASSSASRA